MTTFEKIAMRQSIPLRAVLPRMNQLALLYDMKLSNPKHFKLLKFVVEVERV